MKKISKTRGGLLLLCCAFLAVSCEKDTAVVSSSSEGRGQSSQVASEALPAVDVARIDAEVMLVTTGGKALSAAYLTLEPSGTPRVMPAVVYFQDMVFLDSGLGFDKVANDGVYTAAYDQEAQGLRAGMKRQLYARGPSDLDPGINPNDPPTFLKITCTFTYARAGQKCGDKVCEGKSDIFGTETILCICDVSCEIEFSFGK